MRVSQTYLRQPQRELESILETLEELRAKLEALLRTISEVSDTTHPYVVRRDGVHGGRPVIAGTRIPVSTIVERIQLGDTPEDIVRDFPPLTLAQVYDALSYYHEHRQEIDAEIATNKEPSRVQINAGEVRND